MRGDLLRAARQGPSWLHGWVPTPSRLNASLTPPRVALMIGRMIAPAAQMMLLYSGRSSENDEFR
jgi:hypothetical protein